MSVYRPNWKDPKTGEIHKSRVFWFEFTYAGQRIRESAKTTRRTIAVEAEKRKRLELERAYAGLPVQSPATRIKAVSEALRGYREGYGVNHRPASATVVRTRAVHVDRLLGGTLIPELTPTAIVDYMRTRQGEGASNRTINLELEVLARSLGLTWKALWPRTKKLEENRDVGRALEANEEAALMDAATRNQSRLIHPYLMTLAWTGMRSSEARNLRWARVDLEAGEIVVRVSKTEAGRRVVPMSAALRAVLEHHAAWCASKLGPINPDWYVFPKSNRLRPVDGAKPVTSLKRAWESVREKAGVKCRLHDLRHTFCTKMAEAGVPEATMLDMMGHVSATMLRRYSHIRAQARRDAMAALEARAVGVPKESPKVSDSAGALMVV